MTLEIRSLRAISVAYSPDMANEPTYSEILAVIKEVLEPEFKRIHESLDRLENTLAANHQETIGSLGKLEESILITSNLVTLSLLAAAV